MTIRWVHFQGGAGSGATDVDPANTLSFASNTINLVWGTSPAISASSGFENVAIIPAPGKPQPIGPLDLKLPGTTPGTTETFRAIDAMWRLDASTAGSGHAFNLSADNQRNLWIDGMQMDSKAPVTNQHGLNCGTTSHTNKRGLRVTRSNFENLRGVPSGTVVAGGTPINLRAMTDVEVAYCRFKDCMPDHIYGVSNAANGNRAGTYLRVLFCDAENVGKDRVTGLEDYEADFVQVPIVAGAGRVGTLIYGNRIHKRSTTKQGVLVGCGGTNLVAHNLFDGDGVGASTIMFNTVFSVTRAYANVFKDVPVRTMRLESGQNEDVSLGPGALLDIDRNILIGTHEYLFRLPGTGTTDTAIFSANSRIRIRRNVVAPGAVLGLGLLYALAHDAAQIDATFALEFDENANWGAGPLVNFPSGYDFDKGTYTWGKNWNRTGNGYKHGATTYTTPADWTTETGETQNFQELTTVAAGVDTYGKPSTTSPLASGSTLDDLMADFFGRNRAGGSLGGPIGPWMVL